jgi:FAD/FMN-containing dehydrogenase
MYKNKEQENNAVSIATLPWVQELQKSISGDIVFDNATLLSHSTDWSLFSIRPQVIVFPKDASDVSIIVRIIVKYKQQFPDLSLTARAAGTDMTGGPLNTSVIMDTTRYMQDTLVVEKTTQFPDQTSFYGHRYAVTGVARVLPGTYYRDFEKETQKQNLVLPCYPASKDLCAVGGMVANNGAGEKTLKYGQNKDFVKELKVVFSDGNEYLVKPLSYTELQSKIQKNDFEGNLYDSVYSLIKHNWNMIQEKKPITSKNASGYYVWDVVQSDSVESFESGVGFFDLTKLIVGAQGTTGMITEITYGLVDIQSAHDLLVVYVRDLDVVPELVSRLMKFDIEMLEMYDDNTFKIGIKFFKEFLKDKGFFGAIKYSIRFFPEVWMAITKGVPKLIVLAEFTGQDEMALHAEMQKAETALSDLDVAVRQVPRDEEEEKFWDFRHDSFKILTEHSMETRAAGEGTRTVPFIDDIAINPEYLPEYLPQLMNILNEYKLLYTIAGHLGNGNFHVIPLMRLDEIGDGNRILEISEKVYNLANQYRGSFSAEHNDGIIRTPYLEKQFGAEMVSIFQSIKNIFDPLNMFNPGKKVRGTMEDIKKYIAK